MALAVMVTVLLAASMVSALTVLQLNLEQLTALSERVFMGRCVSVRQEEDSSGRPVQYVTFRVEEMLKGEPAERITFKQLGLISPSQEEGRDRGMTVESLFRDMPRYDVGEEAVIFLSAEGNRGFTAPIGLQQGKFRVEKTPAGEKRVVNGVGNRGLFMGWKKSPRLKSLRMTSDEAGLLKAGGGPLPYGDFKSLVKKLAGS